MPKLVLNAGTPQAQEFHLKPGKNYIGRGFANDFKLDDASVSGSHAVFVMNGPIVTVTDLGSTNGTRINQLPATGNPLQPGHVVKLGAIELLYVADAISSPNAPGIPIAPPTPIAAQIATEFIIREPSHVGVAPAAPPPTPPTAAPIPVPALKIPTAAPNPPPAPIAAAPAPVPQIIPSAPPPPVPILIPAAPAPTPALKIPVLAPVAPPTPPAPIVSAPVITAPPAPVPQRIIAPPAPPPPPSFAAAAAESPPVSGGSRLTLAGVSHAPPAQVAPVLAAAPASDPVAAPAPSVGAEPMEAPAGLIACKFHRNVSGQWLCQKCTQLFCSLCVVTRPTPAGTGHFCRACGTQCVAVKMKAIAKKKEKQLVAYSEGTIVLRTLNFGLGGAILCGGIWAGFTACTGFDMPAIFAPLSGVGCGYAIKIASQDRPGGFFSIAAIVTTLLAVAIGMFGAILITHHFLFTINSLAMGVFGLCLGVFVAWKIGGGDF